MVSGLTMVLSANLDPGVGKNLVTSVATGTLVSAIVGFGQTLITATATQRAMLTPLVDESRQALRDLSAEYRSMNREFFPTHVFEPTAEPNPALNRLMMQDLQNTRQYLFRGFSGRHAAARLLLSNAEWELRAVVADPDNLSGISGRARYLIRHSAADVDADTIQARLHEEIRMGLVGLYLARSRCSRMEVTIISDPPLDRLEIFDDSVWVTLYSDAHAPARYPRTLRFSDGSFIYNMERAEFGRISASHHAHHLVITPDMTRQEFISRFEKITNSTLTEEQFLDLNAEFYNFLREFAATAELGS
ncbi:hypothetical protein [Actinophytocola algeriensis]|uniref:Uncharacterized protein n=1 Tax=Actinophytocola algeriensis TaxID=1768010 RepID=A0A7W7Q8L6_9PSEU|nr:hypothetical protein [Actinophytocola algeriensis]MBB4909077.1 hypothetical protein [Actinophytocola algeriensis]MBE1474535.1 hypothetical protein [Actinophytocola algeriensis]